MNTLTAIAPVITADHDALRRDFPLKPFAIRTSSPAIRC
jgi:hypothetical protein